MVNPCHYVHSGEEENRSQSPPPNSQGSEDSAVQVNELEATDDPISNEDMSGNTQAILNLPAAMTAAANKKKQKNKGIGKGSVLRQKKVVQTMNFFLWLKNYWDSESSIQLMGKFVSAIKQYALTHQNAQLGRLVRPVNQIMKEFILHLSKQRLSLKKVSWESFESWALNQGLSTMFSNAQAMGWENDFDEILFKIYGQVYIQTQEEVIPSSEEEEESSSLPNTKTTSTSSMTARTREEVVDADLCGTSKSTSRKRKTVTFSSNNPGSVSTKHSISKSKTNPKKSTTDSERRQAHHSEASSAEEQESDMEDLLMQHVPTKKQRRNSSESEAEDSENLNDMLDAAVRAQCLLRTTGSISQSMSLKHLDNVITLKSRGERGTKVIKFEIYSYSDCLRRDKQEWWQYAEVWSLFLQYSENSRVSNLLEQLTKEIFKQIQQTKKVEIKTAVYKRT